MSETEPYSYFFYFLRLRYFVYLIKIHTFAMFVSDDYV